jgi:hypothetical protein
MRLLIIAIALALISAASADVQTSVTPRQAYVKARACLIRNGAHQSRKDPIKWDEGIVYFGPERRGHWASWAYVSLTSNGVTRVAGLNRTHGVLTRYERRVFVRCTKL